MKVFINLSITAAALLLTLPAISGHHEEGAKDPMMKNVMTAKKWVEAGYTSKEKAMKIVKKYMAEDGYNYGSRFIGFGFYYDPNSEDRLVDGVIEGSPAAKVLKVGDKFVSVNGVQATKENWDNGKLTFGGAPGGKVEVEVLRNGKTIKRSFKRGMVNPKSTKSQVLDNMNDAVAEDWPAIDYKIIEVAGNPKEKVVYVWSWNKSMNTLYNKEAESNVVTRFRFNDDGQVVALSNLSEELLVQNQLGFRLTR